MTFAQTWTGPERRSAPRFVPREGASATCSTGLSGLGWNVALAVLNVSENGVCLALKELLAKREVVEVGLLAPGWARPVKRLGVVVWCDGAGEGVFRTGILLSRALACRELQDLCHVPGP